MAIANIKIAVYKNGVLVPNSTFISSSPNGIDSFYGQISGQVTLDLLPTDVVSVRSVGQNSINAQGSAITDIVASVNVVKVD